MDLIFAFIGGAATGAVLVLAGVYAGVTAYRCDIFGVVNQQEEEAEDWE